MVEIKVRTRSLRQGRFGEPHQRLMAAVLQTAVDDCRHRVYRGAPSSSDLRRAVVYVASRDRGWPFSFENLCEALSLDAEVLRRSLRKEPEE